MRVGAKVIINDGTQAVWTVVDSSVISYTGKPRAVVLKLERMVGQGRHTAFRKEEEVTEAPSA